MATVKDLMGAKTDASRYAIKGNEKIYHAMRLMADRHIGAVLVVEKGIVTGIFTERDYIMRVEVEGLSAKETCVKEVMTEKMYTVTTGTSIKKCMELMIQFHVRHLPVVENGQLLGIVSMRDAVAGLLNIREGEIEGLDEFKLDSGFQG